MSRRRGARKRATPWQRRRRRVLLLVAIPLTLIAVWISWRISVRRDIDAQWAAFEAAGYATTLEDLFDSYPAVAGEENGATALDEALAGLLADDEFNRQWRAAQEDPYSASVIEAEYERGLALKAARKDTHGEGWNDATTILVHEFLGANADAMAAVELALDAPGLQYSFDQLTAPYGFSQFEHWRTLPLAARLFSLQAALRLNEGDIDGAIASMRTLFRLGDVLRDEPLYHSQVTRSRCDAAARASLTNLLDRVQLDEDTLIGFQEAAARASCTECWTRALAGDAVMVIDQLRKQTDNSLLLGASLLGFHDRDVAIFLKQVRNSMEIADVPWYLQSEEQRRVGNQSGSAAPWQPITSPLSTFHVGLYRGAATFIAREQAHAATATIALAVERYRLANDRLPETLDELVPRFMGDLPLDPYTGLAYSYDGLDAGYTIHGTNTGRNATSNNEGIAFTVTR